MKQKFRKGCMVLGALLLLAAAVLTVRNLWEARSAAEASQQVMGELEQVLTETGEEEESAGEEAAQTPDPAREMPTAELDGREYIGCLSIPAAGLELPVMSQWSYAGLKIAPGRYTGSVYADDMVICAHNYARHFGPIRELTEGAQVYFTDMDGLRWSYTVSAVETLEPTQIEAMTDKTAASDSWDLTLFTCTPGGSARSAVRCVRVGEPAPAGA